MQLFRSSNVRWGIIKNEVKALQRGRFLYRENRFIAHVALEDGKIVQAHLANTGRMSELLFEGVVCLLVPAANTNRKTAWDLVWIRSRGRWVCLRSVYANHMVETWMRSGCLRAFSEAKNIVREKKIGHSRFDFSFDLQGNPWLVEVKAVNLVLGDKLALFPDAPTSRGKQHIEELLQLSKEGYQTGLILVVMGLDVDRFQFNKKNDPALAAVARQAYEAGMAIHAYTSFFEPPDFYYDGSVPVEWEM